MVLGECPFCHKLFSAEEISRKQVNSQVYTPNITPGTLNPSRRSTGPTHRPEDYPTRDFIHYEITYRCKHCNKEWTKLVQDEVDIPRSYSKAEDEKTEADGEHEEELAREERYARD